MLYNTEKGKIWTNMDCLTCEYFDKKLKKCKGKGKICFEMDKKTQTLIDPITGLPIKPKGGKNAT